MNFIIAFSVAQKTWKKKKKNMRDTRWGGYKGMLWYVVLSVVLSYRVKPVSLRACVHIAFFPGRKALTRVLENSSAFLESSQTNVRSARSCRTKKADRSENDTGAVFFLGGRKCSLLTGSNWKKTLALRKKSYMNTQPKPAIFIIFDNT